MGVPARPGDRVAPANRDVNQGSSIQMGFCPLLMQPETTVMLDLALERRAYLERLAERPAWKRDLIDDLGDSRSTVDRSIEALTDAGLVAERDNGFETTYAGRVLLDTVTEATAIAEPTAAAAELADHLPDEAPRNHRFFAGGDVVSMDRTPPAVVVDRLTESLAAADRVRGAAIAPNSEQFIDVLYRRSVVEEALRMELLVPASLVPTLVENYPDRLQGSLTSEWLAIRVVDSLPFAFYLMEADGATTARLLFHGPHDNLLGYVENDREAAVEWMEGLYTDFRDASRPLADIAAEHPEWPIGG
jgi:predicted transcriptional regulator